MGEKRKTVHKLFSYRNCDDFAAYLNHMARQGWNFREWRAGLVFEQGEPAYAGGLTIIVFDPERTAVVATPNGVVCILLPYREAK